MNLPATAIEFLDAYRGVLAPLKEKDPAAFEEVYEDRMPMVHCYAFTRELDVSSAGADLRKRAEEYLGGALGIDGEDVHYHLVRDVAPHKRMYCISFRLPRDIALGVKGGLNQTRMASSTDAVSPSAPLEGVKAPLAAASRSLSTPESELKRWKRIFDSNAKDFSGQRYLDRESFISAIASQGDLSRIDRESFGVLFRVADTSRRGLVSWDDFTVFETLLKRPDAEYWIAFQYFDE
ncbi:mitochondrial aspartate-glutamate transporter agc1 [Tulasnella sp. 408]|nr:mitochondrial aspartate-glutamate transporter agc1 [Tulasnella sp. 408]